MKVTHILKRHMAFVVLIYQTHTNTLHTYYFFEKQVSAEDHMNAVLLPRYVT